MRMAPSPLKTTEAKASVAWRIVVSFFLALLIALPSGMTTASLAVADSPVLSVGKIRDANAVLRQPFELVQANQRNNLGIREISGGGSVAIVADVSSILFGEPAIDEVWQAPEPCPVAVALHYRERAPPSRA